MSADSYPCSVCGELCGSHEGRLLHAVNEHSDKSPHPCPHCGEPFDTREERLMHALYSYNCLRRGDDA